MKRRTVKKPHPRRDITKDRNGDPRWQVVMFSFFMLLLLTQGAIVYAPLYWLGIVNL